MSVQDKIQNFTGMFGTGRTVSVLLDPRKEGIDLPEHLCQLPSVKLHFGLALPTPIENLSVTDTELKASLLFGQATYECTIPWSSVFALLFEDNQSGRLWPEDVPAEIEVRGPEMGPPPDAEEKKLVSGNEEQGLIAPEDKKKMFGVVDGDGEGPSEAPEGSSVEAPSLRLITNDEDEAEGVDDEETKDE